MLLLGASLEFDGCLGRYKQGSGGLCANFSHATILSNVLSCCNPQRHRRNMGPLLPVRSHGNCLIDIC